LLKGVLSKELDAAIKRLEAGEDPEKIEEDMGDVLNDFAGTLIMKNLCNLLMVKLDDAQDCKNCLNKPCN
jgi:hypothetical protein